MLAAILTGIIGVVITVVFIWTAAAILIWFRTTIFEYLLTMGDDIVYSKDCGLFEGFFPTFYRWFK